jgi:GxxExxY protein
MELLHGEITNLILKAFYSFRNELTIGIDLSFFRNGLEVDLNELGLETEVDKHFEINYKNKQIGILKTDILVNKKVAIKIVSSTLDIEKKEELEMKIFLSQTNIEVGLILNFGMEGIHKRVLHTNNFKRDN